ncbi:MAG: T9SS type A sorting domain-containing protein [Bacteroidetes bacterium]|nr:T9SS type A sorting domain-containing protein [Bacteroidota bacterium]
MKKICILLLILSSLQLLGQQTFSYDIPLLPSDSLVLSNYPELELPEAYKGPNAKSLPDVHDNSQFQYFRPIFNQYGWSCGQASTIGYNFTYEINRANNTAANVEDHQFPPSYTFNFFNRGENSVGVCYRYSLETLKEAGNPTVTDYGGMGDDLSIWITGYDKYYNGMKNRIDNIYTIHVGDEEGLQILKYWLYDHLEGSPYGGLANFYTDLYGFTYLPEGTPEAGKAVITEFGPYNGHSMTFIGWNDNIRWDYNNDGQYTNDIDINGDDEINMKDWEIGGVILANSWGEDWADSGFCYVMYNVLAQEKQDGGIWNKQVNVFDVKQNYQPTITFKINLEHDSRCMIKVMAGVSSDTNDLWPKHIMEFPIFNYQGGDYYMQGNNSAEIYKTLEFGLDVTPLLSHINPAEPARFFLQLQENDPANSATGKIIDFSLMDYTGIPLEIPCSVNDLPIVENGITTLSVVHAVTWDKVGIDTEELPAFTTGENYSHQMAASGGTPPYKWSVDPGYEENIIQIEDPNISGIQLNPNNSQSGWVTQKIDFQFPFYDFKTDSITIHVDGFLMFDEIPYPLPYQVDDRLLFKNERMIAVLLNKDLKLNSGSGDGIWYEGDDDHAAFRWKGTVEVPGDDYHLDFTTILYPDGKIELFINDYDDPEELNRITGISNGDGQNLILSGVSNILPAEENQSLVYLPTSFPVESSITDEGLLTVAPEDEQKIYNLNIRVTDDHNISATKTFQLSSGLLYTYSILSGNNGMIDAGETAHLSFTVKNAGNQILNNLLLTALIDDNYINLLDNVEDIGELAPGESVDLVDAISFEVANFTPDGYTFTIDLDFSSDDGNWESILNLQSFAPSIAMGSPIILDGDNGRLDPGETADLVIPLFNSGQSIAEEVTGEILSFDPYITFNSSALLNYGNIFQGEVKYDTLNVTVDENTPQGHFAWFNLLVSAQPDIQITHDFELLIGRYPVCVVDLDPDLLSGPVIIEILEELDIMYDYDYALPVNINSYQNLFVVLGRKFGQHVLTDFEATVLKDFLEEGGNIYMEGGLTWYDDPQTVVHPMFGLTTEYINWHDADSVFGADGTPMQPMSFAYQGAMSYYNYHLLPGVTAFPVLTSQLGEFNFAIANETEDYKTIGSTIDFGALVDNVHPSTKKNLMAKILEFFGTEVTLTDLSESIEPDGIFHLTCLPNPLGNKATFIIQLPKNDIVDLNILDIQGNILKSFAHNRFVEKGTTRINIDLFDLPTGIYIGQLKTQNQILNIKIVKTI